MNQKHVGKVEFKLNKFFDRDPETDLKKMNGAKSPQKLARLNIFEKRRTTTNTNQKIVKTEIKDSFNDSLDWRAFNIVTPIRDQGACGYIII